MDKERGIPAGKTVPPLRQLKDMPADAHAQIWEWVHARPPMTQAEIRGRIAEAYGIVLRWDAQLTEWREWYALRLSFASAQQQAREAETAMTEFDPADLERARQFGQYVFTQAAIREQDPRTFAQLARLQIQRESLALMERRITLLEDAAAKAKAALESVRSRGGLTPETLASIEEAARLL